MTDLHPIDPGLYKLKLKEISRALEKEMGLTQVRNERDPDEKTRPAGRGEYEHARRLKTDLKAIREGIRECWDTSRDGAGFAAALEAKGLVLARGDQRAFVIVDEKGGMHALSKRITGVPLATMKARLSDIDPASLPSVAEARAMQRERREEQEVKGMPQEPAADRAVDEEEDRKREAIQREDEQRQQAIKEAEERGAYNPNKQAPPDSAAA